MEEIIEDPSTPPYHKRRRIGDDNVDSSFIKDSVEFAPDNNEEQSSIFDTAFTSQIPDDIDQLPSIENVVPEDLSLQLEDNNIATESLLNIQETPADEISETNPIHAQEIAEIDEDDADDNLPRGTKDLLSWNRVTVNGNKIIDKNSIQFIRLCLNSILRTICPSENVRLTKNTVSVINRLLYRFGFLQNFKFDGVLLNRKSKHFVLSKDMLSTITINLDMFCKNLNKFTEAINKFYWVRYFALPEDISDTPPEFRSSYNQNLIEKIKRFHKAISDDDWQLVGHLIGSIDIDSNLKAGNNLWYGKWKTLVTYNLLWENLFFIGFQRILLRNIPPRMKAISLEHMLNKFSRLIVTETFKIRKLLPLFIISILTFGLAHDNKDSVTQILNIKIDPRYNEPELNFNLRAYQLYNQYKQMCEDSDTTPNQMLDDLFQTMREFFESATEKQMTKLLLLFEPLVLLSQHVEEETRALEVLIRYCNEYPALLAYAATILRRCGLGSSVGRLISECVEHDPSSTFLYRFPLILHYAGQRTIQALTKSSLKYDEAEKHVRMCFNFFDYGRNRTTGDAWFVFKQNLEYLKPFPEWVYQEWNERADWWPQFHYSIPLERFEDARTQVFRLLRKQNKKRKF